MASAGRPSRRPARHLAAPRDECSIRLRSRCAPASSSTPQAPQLPTQPLHRASARPASGFCQRCCSSCRAAPRATQPSRPWHRGDDPLRVEHGPAPPLPAPLAVASSRALDRRRRFPPPRSCLACARTRAGPRGCAAARAARRHAPHRAAHPRPRRSPCARRRSRCAICSKSTGRVRVRVACHPRAVDRDHRRLHQPA